MESRSSSAEHGRAAEIAVFGPDGAPLETVELSGGRVTVGRLPGINDVALQPDPELLVTGTYLRRAGTLQRVEGRAALHDGDVVCVLASIADSREQRFFELAFHASEDSQATRAALVREATPPRPATECLSYDSHVARLVLVQNGERHELQIRA